MVNYLDGVGKEFCLHCKKKRTEDGHDGCIGTLKNVMNACCGHGEIKMAYIQFEHKEYNSKNSNKIRISGQKALNYIKKMKYTKEDFKEELIQLRLFEKNNSQTEYSAGKLVMAESVKDLIFRNSEQLRYLIKKFQTPKGNYIIELLMEFDKD